MGLREKIKKAKAKKRKLVKAQAEMRALQGTGVALTLLTGVNQVAGAVQTTSTTIRDQQKIGQVNPNAAISGSQKLSLPSKSKIGIKSTNSTDLLDVSKADNSVTNHTALTTCSVTPAFSVSVEKKLAFERDLRLFSSRFAIEALLNKPSNPSLTQRFFGRVKSLVGIESRNETYVLKGNGPGEYLVYKGPHYQAVNCGTPGHEDLEFTIPIETVKKHQSYFDWVKSYSPAYQRGGHLSPYVSANALYPELPVEYRPNRLNSCMQSRDLVAIPMRKFSILDWERHLVPTSCYPDAIQRKYKLRSVYSSANAYYSELPVEYRDISVCTKSGGSVAVLPVRKLSTEMENLRKELEKTSEDAQSKTSAALKCVEELQGKPIINSGFLKEGRYNDHSTDCTFVRFDNRFSEGPYEGYSGTISHDQLDDAIECDPSDRTDEDHKKCQQRAEKSNQCKAQIDEARKAAAVEERMANNILGRTMAINLKCHY